MLSVKQFSVYSELYAIHSAIETNLFLEENKNIALKGERERLL